MTNATKETQHQVMMSPCETSPSCDEKTRQGKSRRHFRPRADRAITSQAFHSQPRLLGAILLRHAPRVIGEPFVQRKGSPSYGKTWGAKPRVRGLEAIGEAPDARRLS